MMVRPNRPKYLLLNDDEVPQALRFLQILRLPTLRKIGFACYVDQTSNARPDILILTKKGDKIRAHHKDEPNNQFTITQVVEDELVTMYSLEFSAGDVTWFIEESVARERYSMDDDSSSDDDMELHTDDSVRILSMKKVGS